MSEENKDVIANGENGHPDSSDSRKPIEVGSSDNIKSEQDDTSVTTNENAVNEGNLRQISDDVTTNDTKETTQKPQDDDIPTEIVSLDSVKQEQNGTDVENTNTVIQPKGGETEKAESIDSKQTGDIQDQNQLSKTAVSEETSSVNKENSIQKDNVQFPGEDISKLGNGEESALSTERSEKGDAADSLNKGKYNELQQEANKEDEQGPLSPTSPSVEKKETSNTVNSNVQDNTEKTQSQCLDKTVDDTEDKLEEAGQKQESKEQVKSSPRENEGNPTQVDTTSSLPDQAHEHTSGQNSEDTYDKSFRTDEDAKPPSPAEDSSETEESNVKSAVTSSAINSLECTSSLKNTDSNQELEANETENKKRETDGTENQQATTEVGHTEEANNSENNKEISDEDQKIDFPTNAEDKDLKEEEGNISPTTLNSETKEGEKTVREVESEQENKSKETAREDTQDIDSTLTKVVISEEGIPQVTLTTVPDRPPSSAEVSVEDETEKVDKINKSEDSEFHFKSEESQDKPNSVSEEISDIRTKMENNTHEMNEEEKREEIDEDIKEASEKGLNESDPDKIGDQTEEITENGVKNNEDSRETKETSEGDEISKNANDDTINKTDTSQEDIDPSDPTAKTGGEEFETDAENREKEDENVLSENENVQDVPPITCESEEISHVSDTGKESNQDEPKTTDDSGEKDHVDEPETDKSHDIRTSEKNKTENSQMETKTEHSEQQNVPEEPPESKLKSPLEQLLEKNVEIEENVEILNEFEFKMVVLLTSMKNVVSHYSKILKLQTLRDFTQNLGKFRGDFQSVHEAFKRWDEISVNLNKHFKELKNETDDVKTTLYRKFQQEDLSTWIDTPPEKEHEKELLQEQINAAEKAAMAKVAEAKHAVATANTGVAETYQAVAEMEKQCAEAEAISRKAAAQAEAALVAAEEARIAAEERRKAEEIAKQRAEERARIKRAEEEKRKAEEEMRIYQEAARKGTNVDDERRTFLEEKARKEAERKNPKNWPKYYYNTKSVDFNADVGCIIRAIEGSMRKSDAKCETVDQSNGRLPLNESEEIVSNIISIKQTEEDRKFSFEEPISVALPVTLSRVPTGKETVVKQLQPNGKWRDLQSSDVLFEDFKEVKFIEGRTQRFGTFVVTLRPKKDQLQATRRGNKVTCSFDSRVAVISRPGSFKTNTNFTLEVNPLDSNAITDLKTRCPKECEDLLTASPFVTLRLASHAKIEKPLTVTLPLPQTQTRQSRQKRPHTGIPKDAKAPEVRPATARVSSVKEEEPTEEIHFLHRDDKTGWTVNKKIELIQPKNKDIATFEISTPFQRMLLLRTKLGKRDSALEKMATLLEQTFSQRNVKIMLRQRHDDVCDVKVACVSSSKTDACLKYLEEKGFTEGPNASPDIVLKEGQQLYMKFRGNIVCVSKKPVLNFVYNTNIRAVRDFRIDEKDSFAQKALQSYRGFVQIYTKSLVPKPVLDGANKSANPEMVEAEILLTELLIELPKPEATPPKPLETAPMFLKEGPLTNGVLRLLAGQLGKEWKDLAGQLELKPMRIQAILRQHLNRDTPETRYDMLVTWAKRVPRAVDKVQILCTALTACGRLDLADEVRQRGQQYKQQRFMNARVSHLKQAFVKVAKAQEMLHKWKSLAKDLGVSEEEIEGIDTKGGSSQEKCYTSLERWQDKLGDSATITSLAKFLRESNQERLSRDVESILSG